MKQIALTGPYNPATRKLLYEMLPEGYEMFDVPGPEDYGKLKEADSIIIRTVRLDGSDLAEAGRLRFIQKWGAGYDTLDIPGISQRDIPVAICAGINAQPVAELAVLHMLAVCRHLLAANAKLKQNIWAKNEFSNRSFLLQGKTVGLLGLGNIGRRVARIVQGFGAQVQYYDMYPIPEQRARELNIRYVALDELLATSDILSLHVPLTEQTRGMLGAQEFAKMKDGAVLINTARGEIVDEQALVQALEHGKLMGAGLDAFCAEPPGEDCPFYQMENVVVTPHIGGNTADNDVNMIARCFENIQRFDQGLPLRRRDLVNAALLQTKPETED